MPVSTYTGMPNVNIPLYTIATRSHTLDLSLSYHASGVRVDEDASWVGLGWSLNAGGVITRSVRGLDDLSGQGVGYKDSSPPPPSVGGYYWPQGNHSQYANIFQGMCGGGMDTEPDVFYFNFAGRSGKFMLDHNSLGSAAANVRLLSLSDNLDIQLLSSVSGQPQWRVTTEDGYRYTFTAIETTGLARAEFGSPARYVSAWYVTQLEAPDGEIVAFHYVPNGTRTETISSYFKRQFLFGNGSGPDYQAFIGARAESSQSSNIYSTQGVLLDSITFATGSVAFTRATRLDIQASRSPVLPALRITGLVVRRNAASGGGIVRRFHLLQSYFNDDITFAPQTSTLWYRLRLDGVEELNGTERIPPYSFSYYQGIDGLPSKTTLSKDHLGYYNGASANSVYNPLPAVTYFHPYTQQLVPVPGCDREPNATYAVTGALRRITYPTGGYTEFEFEGHTYLNAFGRDTLGCGIRLRRMISAAAPSTSPHIQKYLYTLLYTLPGVTLSSGIAMSHPNYIDIWREPQNNDAEIQWLDRSTTSTVPLGSGAQGQGIGYSAVTVLDGENGEHGKTVYEYENAPEVQNGTFMPGVPNIVPVTNGLLNTQSIYRWHNNQFVLVKQIDDRYATTEEEALRSCVYRSAMCNPVILQSNSPVGNTHIIDYEYYYNTTRFYNTVLYWNRLSEHVETTYATTSPAYPITRRTHYDYNPTHRQVSCVTVTVGDKMEKTYSLYPADYPALTTGPVHDLATTRHQLTTVVERYSTTVRNNQEVVTGGQFTHFGYAGTKQVIVPVTIDKLVLTTPVPLAAFVSSTGNGNPDAHYQAAQSLRYDPITAALQSVQQDKGIVTTYNWGLDNQVPILECQNATYRQLAYTSFEPDAPGRWKYDHGMGHRQAGGWTGRWAYRLNGGWGVGRDSLAAGDYELLFWVQHAQRPEVYLTHGNITRQELVAQAPNGWRQFRLKLHFTALGSLTIDALTGGDTKLLDEVRLHPVGARMTSYTHDPLVGMTSQTDPSGRTTTYEYNALGRLLRTRDEQGRILSQQQYHYARP